MTLNLRPEGGEATKPERSGGSRKRKRQKAKGPRTSMRLASVCVCVCVSSLVFLGPHLQHVEVPRLGVERQLQLLAYTTATATLDP